MNSGQRIPGPESLRLLNQHQGHKAKRIWGLVSTQRALEDIDTRTHAIHDEESG